MLFKELLACAGAAIESSRGDATLTNLVSDSRRCKAGSCFVAVRGEDQDGHKYISAAVAAGAVAVVCEDASAVPASCACATVKSARSVVGRLAQAFGGWPARKLSTLAVTGTKGKSTVTYLARAILEAAGKPAALFGTISYETGGKSIEANNTTPGAVDLAEMMAQAVAVGKTHLVMEVSSHSLVQDRVAGVPFAAAIFTNLTGEHLDYHKTMDGYLAAKRVLFEQLAPGSAAVINRDDPAGEAMAEAARAAGARVIFYGLSDGCDVRGEIVSQDAKGSELKIHLSPNNTPKQTALGGGTKVKASGGGTVTVRLPLIGRHNVYNALAAGAACAAVGVEWDVVARSLGTLVRVPGRLQRVEVDAPYEVFVDYAHTDDALKNVLSAVRPLTRGRLIAMFGCGGNRDRTKRPRMARVAAELADVVIITSDNPRKEEPQMIIDEIVAGLDAKGLAKARIEADRRKAIGMAIGQARAGDVVVLAGKGHENYQIIGDKKHHFDDIEEAAAAMACAGERRK